MDLDGNYRCLNWIALPSNRAIYTTTGMRNHNFPVVVSEVLGMIGMFDISEKLDAHLKGETVAVSRSELHDRIAYFEKHFEMRSALSGGGRVPTKSKNGA